MLRLLFPFVLGPEKVGNMSKVTQQSRVKVKSPCSISAETREGTDFLRASEPTWNQYLRVWPQPYTLSLWLCWGERWDVGQKYSGAQCQYR